MGREWNFIWIWSSFNRKQGFLMSYLSYSSSLLLSYSFYFMISVFFVSLYFWTIFQTYLRVLSPNRPFQELELIHFISILSIFDTGALQCLENGTLTQVNKFLFVNLVSKTKCAMAVSEVFSGIDPDNHQQSLFL